MNCIVNYIECNAIKLMGKAGLHQCNPVRYRKTCARIQEGPEPQLRMRKEFVNELNRNLVTRNKRTQIEMLDEANERTFVGPNIC